MRWAGWLPNGRRYGEQGDGSGAYGGMYGNQLVNDGLPHTVVVKREAGIFYAIIDCAVDNTMGSSQVLGQLPPVATNNDVCVGAGQMAPLTGTLTGVCIAH